MKRFAASDDTSDIHTASIPSQKNKGLPFYSPKLGKVRNKYSLQTSILGEDKSIVSNQKYRLSNSAINLYTGHHRDDVFYNDDVSDQSMLQDVYEDELDGGILVTGLDLYDSSVPSPIEAQRTTFNDKKMMNVQELVKCLRMSDVEIQLNAAACLQHLSFQNEEAKNLIRQHNGVPILILMLKSSRSTCQINAAGVLRNLSYGPNMELKKQIKTTGGFQIIEHLIENSYQYERRLTESLLAILYNLSSYPAFQPSLYSTLKKVITCVLIPFVNVKDTTFKDQSTEFYCSLLEYTTGFIKNMSNTSKIFRQQMRKINNLVSSLCFIIENSCQEKELDSKIVENCICTLRNLCFAIQEIYEPDYLDRKKNYNPMSVKSKSEGSVSQSSQKSLISNTKIHTYTNSNRNLTNRNDPVSHSVDSGERFWNDEIIDVFLPIIHDSSNYASVEAAIGAVQNLAACDWSLASEFRFNFRKKKGLPAIIIQVNNGCNSIVNTAMSALRNLAEDDRNLDLIGKHCIAYLLKCLPSTSCPVVKRIIAKSDGEDVEEYLSLDTIYGVLSLLYLTLQSNTTFCINFVSCDGISQCMFLLKSDRFYKEHIQNDPTNQCVNAQNIPVLAAEILRLLWSVPKLSSHFRKENWTSEDFCVQSSMDVLKMNLSCSAKNQSASTAYFGKPYVKARSNTLLPWTFLLMKRQSNVSMSQDNLDRQSVSLHRSQLNPRYSIQHSEISDFAMNKPTPIHINNISDDRSHASRSQLIGNGPRSIGTRSNVDESNRNSTALVNRSNVAQNQNRNKKIAQNVLI